MAVSSCRLCTGNRSGGWLPIVDPVRLTEFWKRMDTRFGESYARSYAVDHVLSTLGGRTVDRALADGDDPKLVWRAVCDATQAPASER